MRTFVSPTIELAIDVKDCFMYLMINYRFLLLFD